MKTEMELRKELCLIGQRLYEKDYIVATDGNMSVRLPGNILLFTPSGVCKGELSPDQILKTDIHGNKISGQGKPSSELAMHLAAYETRSDIRAVVHAHPPTAVALTVAGQTLETILIPEIVFHVGTILTAPYATPGTQELANSTKSLLAKHDAALMERHGVIAVGDNLTQAFHRVECVEYTAKIAWLARQMGNLSGLEPAEISKLMAMKNRFSIKKS